jgi:NAD(P)H dehydrogenase (quinone)
MCISGRGSVRFSISIQDHMRVLVIYAHPDPDSLNGALHRQILESLSAAGHEVDDIDLYADGFDPVLSAAERRDYFEPELNRARVADYAARIEAAEGLVFCFPTWCLGPPAILKGFFDRVMVPGVSFRLEKDGLLSPNLQHIKRVAAVVTYGRSRGILWWFGDPPRRMMTRYIRWFVSRKARIRYLGLYDLHKPDRVRCEKFLKRVAKAMSGF